MNKDKTLSVMIITLIVIMTGLYASDFALVEFFYKKVPFCFEHLFDDLASYKLFEHISSSIIFGILLIVLLGFIVYYWVATTKKKK
jgi:hypothetical protein